MAKSWAEYKREAKRRQEEAEKTMADAVDPYVRTPFNEFFAADIENDGGAWGEVEMPADFAGLKLPDLTLDGWPEFESDNLAQYEIEDRKALGRAEMLAAAFEEGVRVLAEKINRFKREEVEARIAELEASDLSDPAAKKRALDDIVKLNRLKARLEKNERRTIPVYVIKG